METATPDTSDREALRRQIIDKAVVHGRVVLSSGREADYYVDLRRVTLDAEAAPLVGRVMLEVTRELEFDAVGGLTLGADPVAAAMLHAAAADGRQLDAFVVRKEGKAHGLPRLTDGGYDLVFVDADKKEYPGYLEQALRLLRPGGLVVFDNALWHGRVADPAIRDEDTTAIRELGRAVREDERLMSAMLPCGDGLLCAVKRPD